MKLKNLVFLSLLLSTSAHSQVTPACSSVDADADGDGYGWENNASCIVSAPAQPTGNCIDTPPLNDGWGWNGSTSCSLSTVAAVESDNACIDDDGDGWGWNGTLTCAVSAEAAAALQVSSASVCTDHDGDGWGWNGTDTCLVSGNVLEDPQDSTASVCVDHDGDGYGWNGTASCLIPVDVDNSEIVAADACIDHDGDGYGWNGTDSCLVSGDLLQDTQASTVNACIDHDGDGWGWNGTDTCLISDTASNSTTDPSGAVPLNSQYTRAELDRFVNLATINEFSRNRLRLFKYPDGASITWAINGTYNDTSYNLAHTVFAELSTLTGLSFTEITGDADIDIYFADRSEFNQIANNTVPTDSLGYFQFNYGFSPARAEPSINSAIILIEENQDQTILDHALVEEITQSLGPGNDDFEPDSIFYQYWSLATEFSDSDKVMLEIMYRSGLVGGMTYLEIYNYFGYEY